MDEARRAAKRAADLLGVSVPQLVVYRDRVGLFAADRTILVHPEWLEQQVLAVHCDNPRCRWATLLGMMAHEIAHIIHGDPPETKACELRADKHSGFVLALDGVSPEHLKLVMADISCGCTASHGCDFERLACIELGYGDGLAERLRRLVAASTNSPASVFADHASNV